MNQYYYVNVFTRLEKRMIYIAVSYVNFLAFLTHKSKSIAMSLKFTYCFLSCDCWSQN